MTLRLAIGLLSAAALAYELLLMRLFSIVQWHHFAYMVISLALLGYGASGTFLTLFRRRLEERFPAAFLAGAILFSALSVLCFFLGQRLPFNPLELAWDPRQLVHLAALYLLLAVPFFCAGGCIGLTLSRFPGEVHRLYRADLLGAGAGALGALAALFLLPAPDCLLLVASCGLLAAAAAALDRRLRLPRGPAAILLLLAAAVPLLWPAGGLQVRLSEYKGLSRALRAPGARVLAERSSPLALLSVVESPRIPFRHAPGLSLAFHRDLPPQLGVFTDGEGLSVINRFPGSWDTFAFLDFLPSALPYHLLREPAVLVIGAGGGTEVLSALFHGAREVEAVEYNPQMVALVRRDFGEFAGHPYEAPAVRLEVAEARSFLARASRRYDLIQIAFLDSAGGSAAGVHALSESYLYTVEAFVALLEHLEEGGLLAVSRWLEVPPRDNLKLFATAVSALERRGVQDPGESLAWVRGWNTATLLVKRGRFEAAEIRSLRAFSEGRSFDAAYYPGMSPDQANRFNLLEEPYLYQGARALLGPDRQEFYRRYKFDIRPATDDRPYFFRSFKWRALPELLSLRGRGGNPLIQWGYLVLAATLFQAALAGLVLIILPLGVLRGRPRAGGGKLRVAAYFLSLGLAFLFVEIAMIQRFSLFLGHPLYAVAVVLAAFLVFAGLGSGTAERLRARLETGAGGRPSAITAATLGAAAVALLYLLALPPVFARWIHLPTASRILLSLALIAPLAFLMGMPFPLGLRRAEAADPDWIPWAWAINGCASVASAVLATLLAVHFGFTTVILAAAGLYAAAAASLGRWSPRPPLRGARNGR